MDKAEADHCVQEMLAHLTTWSEDNGYKVSLKNCVYDPRAGFANITLTVIEENGCSAEEHDLKEYAKHDFTDIKPEWIGEHITIRGRQAKLFGYKPRSHKYPFLCECGNGDVFKVTEATIVKQFTASAA